MFQNNLKVGVMPSILYQVNFKFISYGTNLYHFYMLTFLIGADHKGRRPFLGGRGREDPNWQRLPTRGG